MRRSRPGLLTLLCSLCLIVTPGFAIGFEAEKKSEAGAPAAKDTPAAAGAPTAPAPVEPVKEDPKPTVESVNTAVSDLKAMGDLLWTCIAAFFVFFMQMGFACVEAGLTRAKNTCNIMMKNLMDFCIGSIAFWAIGFSLMFAPSVTGFIGDFSHAFLDPDKLAKAGEAINIYGKTPNWTYGFLIFQTVFAATAATIVSGAMAERTKFSAYLVYSFVISLVIYPISGGWAWGSLWNGAGFLEMKDNSPLKAMGLPAFIDFAGSSVVHLCGGMAALAGAMIIGPRKGKYDASGRPLAIPGHNMALLTVGVFVLWLGWFGFNPGSTTALGTGDFARIAVVTNIAACAGGLTSMFTIWAMTGKPEISMTLNGVLAGLVAITAGCNTMTITGGICVGGIAGVLVVLSVVFWDRIGIDDPVGAISVHGVCGAFGTLMCAVPFFCLPEKAGSFVTQGIGVLSIGGWSLITTAILFLAIKATIGLRVSENEEVGGLDAHEHGNEAYHGFAML